MKTTLGTWMLVCTATMGMGCASLSPRAMGAPSRPGRIVSASSVATMARSYRLDEGYFFGHDVRPFESVVYVLDLSGSMGERTGASAASFGRRYGGGALAALARPLGGAGVAATDAVLSMDKKVELVKDHLNASLRGLQPGAKFNVVLFSGQVETMSPIMIGANAATTTAVSAFVAKLREGGSTNLKAAIEAGLATDARDIIVLTDGMPTDASPDQILTMVASRNPGRDRRVFTVGVGDDQAEPFLAKLAEDNGGAYLAYK